ncbi:hypothetical protein GQ53DRAFT_803319 [Thozetella sp. PMI_491]|nr:hypothetical protein GQ53DRAFT_803319 [Thozetella sp. PMI_491]
MAEMSRSIGFHQRKGSLFKQADELSVLCSIDVVVLIFGNDKKLYEYSSDDISGLLNRYNSHGEPNERRGRSDFEVAREDEEDDGKIAAPPANDYNLTQRKALYEQAFNSIKLRLRSDRLVGYEKLTSGPANTILRVRMELMGAIFTKHIDTSFTDTAKKLLRHDCAPSCSCSEDKRNEDNNGAKAILQPDGAMTHTLSSSFEADRLFPQLTEHTPFGSPGFDRERSEIYAQSESAVDLGYHFLASDDEFLDEEIEILQATLQAVFGLTIREANLTPQFLRPLIAHLVKGIEYHLGEATLRLRTPRTFSQVRRPGKSDEELWVELWHYLFPSDSQAMDPHYHVVMEHFELSKMYLESLHELVDSLDGFDPQWYSRVQDHFLRAVARCENEAKYMRYKNNQSRKKELLAMSDRCLTAGATSFDDLSTRGLELSFMDPSIDFAGLYSMDMSFVADSEADPHYDASQSQQQQ